LFIKYKIASLVVFLSLIGCATSPQTPFESYQAKIPFSNLPYKAGASWSSSDSDATDCRIEASQRVPQNIVESTTPTYTTPVSSQCNQIGTQTLCTQTGGRTRRGRTTSTDTNVSLRTRAYEQCMVNKNYRFVDIPACPPVPNLHALIIETALFPPLTPTTCYRADANQWVLFFDG
jgi:hypothetical protein